MWLLLALSCEFLFGVVFSQAECPLPDTATIATTIRSIVASDTGEGTNANSTLLQYHFTCIAVGSNQDNARTLSIAVRYNVTSEDQPEVQRIIQLRLECTGAVYSHSVEPNQPESLFNLATRRNCSVCATVVPPGTMGYDEATNCLACDAMCAGGQGGCTSATVMDISDCCRFYDVVTRMCINTCPAGSINTTDFTCNPCLSSPCQKQGVCSATSSTGFTCNCTGKFTGTNCEMCSLMCVNGGTPNSGCNACMCPAGYTGINCSVNIDDCASNPCGVNGQCIDGLRSYSCNCTAPFTGTNCDTCMLNSCVRCENAECVECNFGLIWNRNVNQCVDACFINPCENGGTCTLESDGSYMCQCPTNRAGTNCTMCASRFAMINSECVLCTDMQCLTCSNGVETCSDCMDGFQVDDNTKQCVAVVVNQDTMIISIGEYIALILGAAFGFIALLLMVTMSLIIIVIVMIMRRKKVKRAKIKDTNSVMYENIEPVSVKIPRFHKNIPEASLSTQTGNIEMKECLAYGVIK